MQILDGKIVSQAIKDAVKEKTIRLKEEGKKIPHLAAILVGNNGASETYVAGKVKSCDAVGFKSSLIRLDQDIEETVLIDTSSPVFQAEMRSKFKNEFDHFSKKLKRSGIDSFTFDSDENFHRALLAFFKRRKRR